MSETDTREREAERYPQIMRAFRETAWAILPETFATLFEVLSLRAQGQQFTAEEIHARVGGREPRRDTMMAGPVAVLPIYGVLVPKADMFTEMSGGSSVERLQSEFMDAVEDENVSAIVLDVDSPGGSTDLITEFAATIRSARGSKPIVASVNPRAGSAAAWLAAQADEIAITRSGEIGSIGVFGIHENISKMLEAAGVEMTVIASSKEKVETLPFVEFSEEAKAAAQARVDEMYGMFVSDMAKGRRVSAATVRSDFGGGRMLSAANAVKVGLADRIEGLDATVQRLSRRRAHAPVPEPPEVPEVVEAEANVLDLTSYADARRTAILAADAVVNRTQAILAAPRGRLSAATRDQLSAHVEALQAAASAITELVAASDPEPETDESLELEWAHLVLAGRRA